MVNATIPTEPCPHCRSGPETYWYLDQYLFDVDRARALATDGRPAVEVEDESTRVSVDRSVLHEPHIDHVNPTYPGVIAHVSFDDGSQVYRGHLLIDGHHRAARCLREGRPFRAYLLTAEESEAILLRRPS